MQATLASSDAFPEIRVPRLGGGTLELGHPEGGGWQMIVVYRGKHCPICKRYLTQLEEIRPAFEKLGIAVVAVSADTADKAAAFVEEVGLTAPVGYDLSVPQMRTLGLYISDPRSAQETDRPFAEPGMFVVNSEGKLHLVDISNAPFSRPDLQALANGLKFIMEKDYPIRGTHAA